jgi:hypothetical protein
LLCSGHTTLKGSGCRWPSCLDGGAVGNTLAAVFKECLAMPYK